MIRKALVNTLYQTASAMCIAADWLSDESDQIWRERMWRQWDALRRRGFEEVVKDGYADEAGELEED